MKLFFVFICFLFTSISLFSQESNKHIDMYSINPKAGVFFGGNNSSGLCMGLESYIVVNNYIYGIEYIKADELIFNDLKPDDVYNNFSLMAGNYIDNKLFRFYCQVGFGVLWGKSYNLSFNKYQSFVNPSVMGKISYKYLPTTWLGIGIDLEANINTKKPLLIPMLSIEFGNLRNKLK